jgi:hypothetical protein
MLCNRSIRCQKKRTYRHSNLVTAILDMICRFDSALRKCCRSPGGDQCPIILSAQNDRERELSHTR